MSIQKPWYKVIVALFKKKSKSILGVCRTMCTSTGEWINKMWYYMQWNIIWQDGHPNVYCNIDEHWKHYAELVKANTDSSQDDDTTSKERCNLVGLDNSFPNKLQGHVIQICVCAIYKLLNGLKDPVKKSKKHVKSKVGLQSYPTLCNYMNCSPPGSSVHGIFQARILEWVATSFSRRSSQPRDWTPVS